MAKRIFKIVAIVLVSFLVVTGGVLGVVALTGGFEKEEIAITNLYFGEETTTRKLEIQTLDDVVQKINFEPFDATDKELKVTVRDDYGILNNPPTKITAGNDLNIRLNRDDKGNNIGGVATLTLSAGIVNAEIKVIVDVEVPNDSLYFTKINPIGYNSDTDQGKITSNGKLFTMAITGQKQKIYLRSQIINAFDLKSNNQNLKSVEISYKYYDSTNKLYDSGTFNNLTPIRFFNKEFYDSYYEIPIVTDVAGTVDFTAKMHRTSEIEAVFKDKGFRDLPYLLKNAVLDSDKQKASLMREEYNDFLNKYIKYFDTTDESYSFFSKNIAEIGKVSLRTADQITQSFNYVFVETKASIEVTAIKLESFESKLETPREYMVFDEVSYSISGNSISSIVDEFGLEIVTDNEDANGAEEEKETMFSSLSVSPYLYLDKNIVDTNSINIDTQEITWEKNKYKFITVYGFNKNKPILEKITESVDSHIGYLLEMTEANDYMHVKVDTNSEETVWKLTCNVPMINDQREGLDIYKALYLGFEISGISSETDKLITKNAFSRVYINYEDLDFNSDDRNNLVIEDVYSYMTINSEIEIPDNSKYAGEMVSSKQDISVDMTGYISNLDTASYTNVMYFVEKGSNHDDDSSSKVVSIGKYKFINYSDSISLNQDCYYAFGDGDLEAERIPTFRTVSVDDGNGNVIQEKQYYLQALNASPNPVKVFAVVYLCDKDGYPIDINGRKLKINEVQDGVSDVTTNHLVVMRISDITDGKMPEVKIDSFVDNVNFYTKSLLDGYAIGEVSFDGGLLKRNQVNYYSLGSGANVNEDILGQINKYLEIKLLKDNFFTLYLSNFDLNSNGTDKGVYESTDEAVSIVDVNGIVKTPSYYINAKANKQHAFNNLKLDINNYTLGRGTGLEVGSPEIEVSEGNVELIKFEILCKETDSNSGTIFLQPDDSKCMLPYSPKITNTSLSGGQGQEQCSNFINYSTHRLEVYDVLLDTSDNSAFKMQNKITAKYADISDGGKKGDMIFHDSGDATNAGEYYITLTDGNLINYDVITNLILKDSGELNLDIVDCSQACLSAEVEEIGDFRYSSIQEYINYYVKDISNTKVEYSRANEMISFDQDFCFTNEDFKGDLTDYIYFGKKTFEIDKNNNEVNINGYILPLDHYDDLYCLYVENGTYFPMINKEYALIYNEMFHIESLNGSNYSIVSAQNDNGQKKESISIVKGAKIHLASGDINVEYKPDDYIASNVFTVDEQENKAKINFKKGQEIGTFEQDENGNYRIVHISDNKYRFEFITNFEGVLDYERYSLVSNMTGVKTYLLLTFPIIKIIGSETSEFTFYKAIEYEIYQKDIEIICLNELPNESNPESFVNSNSEPALLQAGTTNRINLGSGSGININVKVDTNDESLVNFFQHVDFKIENCSIPGIYIVSSDSSSVVINVPHLINETTFTLVMKYYKYDGQTSDPITFFMKVEPDIVFEYNKNKGSQVKISDGNFVIDIEADKTYSTTVGSPNENLVVAMPDQDDASFAEFTYKYFAIGANSGITIDLISMLDNQETSNLIIKSYAEYDETKFIYDKLEYYIRINIGEDDSFILDQKLIVNITKPTYIVDTTDVANATSKENAIVIHNGESLFENFIKLYGNESTVQNLDLIINDPNAYFGVFELSFDGDNPINQGKNIIINNENGGISLSATPASDTTIVITLSYTDTKSTSMNIYITIKGMTMQYSATGNLEQDSSVLSDNVVINLSSDTVDFNLADYLRIRACSDPDNSNSHYEAVLLRDNGDGVYTSDDIVADERGAVNITDLIDTENGETSATFAIAYIKSGDGVLDKIIEVLNYTFTINIESSATTE